MNWLEELREYVEQYGTAPVFEAMPRMTLEDKGIHGPTSAHRIEEIHTPLNFSYITLTTGSTAFQNIVGVTAAEIGDRACASMQALERCGLGSADELLVTYPPLINVFPKQALEKMGIQWSFLKVSSRDALILALCEKRPKAVLGESMFLRATLEGAKRMHLLDQLPRGMTLIAAGTPLDLELLPIAKSIGAEVHDLYGCQEFGWLVLDGIPLRQDIQLIQTTDEGYCDLLVGGLTTGDRFPISRTGHVCNPIGKVITYGRIRTTPEIEATVVQTTASGRETVERLVRTILRIKAKIVRIAPDIKLGAACTVLKVPAPGFPGGYVQCEGPEQTKMFDSLLEAQLQYQMSAKNDPAWNKDR